MRNPRYVLISNTVSQKVEKDLTRMSIIDKAFKLAIEAQNLESKKEYRDAASRYMESVRLFFGGHSEDERREEFQIDLVR